MSSLPVTTTAEPEFFELGRALSDTDRAMQHLERGRMAEAESCARSAMALLTRWIDQVEDHRQNPPPTLELGPGLAWVRTPDGERIDMSRRRAMKLVLRALCARRVQAPGACIDTTELIELGWPGERMRHEAALNRLYVTIAVIRRMFGLRDRLQTLQHGYRLDPDLQVTLHGPVDLL